MRNRMYGLAPSTARCAIADDVLSGRRGRRPLQKRKEERYSTKATGIVRRVDDLGRIVIPKKSEDP